MCLIFSEGLAQKGPKAFRLYNILGVPGVIILDKHGSIRFIGSGLPKNYRETF